MLDPLNLYTQRSLKILIQGQQGANVHAWYWFRKLALLLPKDIMHIYAY